ncbi:Disintegrin and metalloproteinase domain-containing protein 17 [Blomia tropicalis]|nr:Disintegrin and metalloproteinase domain-containing protein 17 [Blomia tropicalis]
MVCNILIVWLSPWGAEHDTDNDKCIPKHNGSYIMSIPFQYSFGENNFEFSPCSIKAIYQNIKTINPKEFECNNCKKCGNGYREADEECDEGEQGGLCCSPHCKLLSSSGAICSPMNHNCCNKHCQAMSAGHICRQVNQSFCRAESQCNGINVTCPEPSILPDNTQCEMKGKCLNGNCQSLCPNDHIECDNAQNDQPSRCECKVCCRPNTNRIESNNSIRNECIPHLFLSDGSPCFIEKFQQGGCYRGKCVLKSITFI